MGGKSTIRRYKSYTCSKCGKPYSKVFKASSFEELEDMIKDFNADESICLRCAGKGRSTVAYRLSGALGVKVD